VRGSGGWGLDWLALGEVVAVAILIEAYICGIPPRMPLFWIAILAVMMLSHVARGEGPAALGFGLREFAAAFPPTVLIVAVLAASAVTAAYLFGTFRNITPAAGLDELLHYFWWGLVQEYVLNAFFLNRLLCFFGPNRKTAAVLSAALLFSAAHVPNWFLASVAIPGGIAASLVYLRFRSLYALGLGHGAIGTIIYIAVPDWMSGHLLVGPYFHG